MCEMLAQYQSTFLQKFYYIIINDTDFKKYVTYEISGWLTNATKYFCNL